MTHAVALKTIRADKRQSTRRKLAENILVGKDVLELVSGAMYLEPLTVIREYVQNAVDSIDEAKDAGLYRGKDKPRVDIIVDHAGRTLRIRDNGIGVANSVFERRLTAFGASKKRGTRARGFRGVGRLSGLGYCQRLIFRSRSAGDSEIMELTWDGRLFKQILQDPLHKGGLNDVVHEVTTVASYPSTDYPRHFFEVELQDVIRYKNDLLLNEQEVEQYISQVGPVPFHPDFQFGELIDTYLTKQGAGASYHVFIGAAESEPKQVFRPFRGSFGIFGGKKDRFTDIEFLEIPGVNGDTAAVGWILDHNYHGAIPRSEGIKGLRLRSGNIQVGSDEIAVNIFPEPRFNSWAVGEFHVIASRLVPNGRRDDFEHNAHYFNLQDRLATRAKVIAKTCRDKSKVRNQERRFNIEKGKIEHKLTLISHSSLPRTMREKLRKEITAHVKTLEKVVTLICDEGRRKKFDQALVQIKERAGKNLDEVVLRDPLARLPRAKQDLYRQVIGLIFECAPNRNVAGALVESILTKLIRK